MDTESALLTAILDAPDDDTRRLVYADYLDEQGEADRAALFRTALEFAAAPDGPERERLRSLLVEHQTREWWRLVAAHPTLESDENTHPMGVIFDRGLLVMELNVPCWPDTVRRPDQPPGLTYHVRLDGPGPHFGAAEGLDWLAEVAGLPIADRVTAIAAPPFPTSPDPLDDRLDWLLTAGPFRRLADLSLPYTGLTDAHLARLARADRSPQLRGLTLNGNPVTAAGLMVLATSGVGRRLQELNYYDTPAAASTALGKWLGSPAPVILGALAASVSDP